MNEDDTRQICKWASGALSTDTFLELMTLLMVYTGHGDDVNNPFKIVYPEASE